MEHYGEALIALEIRRQLGARDQRDLENARQISLGGEHSTSTPYLTPYVKIAVRAITGFTRITHFLGLLRRAFATVEESVIWYTELVGDGSYVLTEGDIAVYHLLSEELSEFCAIFASLRARGSPADVNYQTAVRLLGMLRGVAPPAPDMWERTPTAADDGLDEHKLT